VKTLYLHVGLHKTGSSWIQASLRLSGARLLDEGIAYPLHGKGQGGLPDGKITSGNGNGLLASARNVNRLLRAQANSEHSLLFSSEHLFDALINPDVFARLRRAAAHHGFNGLRMLLFVRDPIEHASSLWQQRVKRKGLILPIDIFSAEHYDYPTKVLSFMDLVQQYNDTVLSVRNYSRCRERLLTEVENWLGVPSSTLITPSVPLVNRSLTHAELTLQLAVNTYRGSSFAALADALCEQLPHIHPEPIRPSAGCQRALLHRIQADVDQLNSRLPQEQACRYSIVEEHPQLDQLTFSREQLDVIARVLAQASETRGGSDGPGSLCKMRAAYSWLRRRWRRLFPKA
jgi:hypothetical protein